MFSFKHFINNGLQVLHAFRNMQVRFDDKLIYDRGYKLEFKYPTDLMIE